ncbi:Pyranose dehydrogenase 3 [Lachnellula cervina]|uniref:Pyranose dehydrogenase 3 n=1 Tax=Lachnellula cervina TaxID=1316786 RepID=A0A7D8UL45_9HELO|nr:Pyranose dehydrogenase 3 [Lachnellula cervina]
MDVMQSAFIKGTGLPAIADGNGGNPIGVAPLTENWHPKGYRQPAGRVYGLKGVEVVTNAQVHRIILDGNVATGAELVDGRRFTAEREVIVCCGAIRTPQVLLLSGIGPAEELARHGIKQLVDSPDVGLNFHDQIAMCQFFKIKNPDNLGLVAGSPLWNDPSYLLGVPADIVIVDTAPLKELKAAMIADGEPNVTDSHPHLQTNRGHLELLPIYAPTEAPLTNLNIPFDGTCITVGQLNLLPTSRGSVTLASPDPSADPVIDPNYFATEADKVVVRHAMRPTMRSFETPEGQTIIEGEITPEGAAALTSKSSDAELDARIRKTASTWFHPGGSAAMGKVVDADLRVIGVERLRVCDVSVLPCPIGAHYQVASYALAEQAADIISKN